MSDTKISPGRQYYVLAVLVFLAGTTVFGWLVFGAVSSLTKELPQYVAPGEYQLHLAEAGKYTIFHEYQSVVENKIYSMEKGAISGLQLSLDHKSSGEAIPLSPASFSSTYSMGSRAGVSVFDFEIAAPGAFVLTARYDTGVDGPEAVLAIGHGFGKNLIANIVGAIGLMFGTLGISVAIAVVTGIKRERAFKQLQA